MLAVGSGVESRNLRVLQRSAFYTGFSFFFLDPYIQIIGVALGASILEIGAFTAAVFAAQLFSNPLAGYLADRFGRRKTLALGGFVRVVSLVMVGLAFLSRSPVTILLGRAFQGLAAGFFWTAVYSIVADETEAGGRGVEFGHVSLWVNRGMIAGAIGGFLLLLIRLDLPPYFFAAAALISGVYALRIIPTVPTGKAQTVSVGPSNGADRDDGRVSAVIGLLSLNFLNSVAVLALTAELIVYVTSRVFPSGVSVNDQAYLIALATAPQVALQAIAAPRFARFSDSMGRMKPLFMSLVFMVPISYAMVWITELWHLAVLGVLLSLVTTIFGVSFNSIVGDLYKVRRGLAYGGLNMSLSLGGFLGALVAGLVYPLGWERLVLASIMIQVVSFSALLLIWKGYRGYRIVSTEKSLLPAEVPLGGAAD